MFLRSVAYTPERRMPGGSGERRGLIDANLYLAQVILSRFSDLFQPFFHQLVFVYIPILGNKDGEFLVLCLRAEIELRGANTELFPGFDDFYCRCCRHLGRCVLKPGEILSR